jgi:glycosyltransferase involved in cell wall biosynthesis
MSKTSIIIPTIGRKTLGATVESILAYPEFVNEIIIVKSCAAELIHRENDKIKVLQAPLSNNVSSARNFGLKNVNSSSQWVAFCDDDDLWLPDKLKIQIEYCLDRNLDASFTQAFLQTGNNKDTVRPRVDYDEDFSPLNQVYNSIFSRTGYLPFSSFCFQSGILHEVSFNEDFIEHEDLLFVHSMYQHGYRVGQVPIPLVQIESNNIRSVRRFSWHQEHLWVSKLFSLSFRWASVYLFRVLFFKYILFLLTWRKRHH